MKLGILGAGQLGRMLALAGQPLGLTFRLLDPAAQTPQGFVSPQHGIHSAVPVPEFVQGTCEDTHLLDQCFRDVHVVTYESENIPVESVRHLEKKLSVYPGPDALETTQDRLHEKWMFHQLGIPTPAFAAVHTRHELDAALQRIGTPSVLKTRRFGYDGKGQHVLRQAQDVEEAWQRLGGVPLIVEEFVQWDREVSLIAVRDQKGQVAFYPLVQNHHVGGILRLTLAPAPGLTPELQNRAEQHVLRILDRFQYVGVLAVEFFQCGEKLLANETAPRVHNSGHWTFEGAETSQFENHLRAITGMPLGPTGGRGYSAMLNLIGEVPQHVDWLSMPGVAVYLYGKTPRKGRKLGHVTINQPNPADLWVLLSRLHARLSKLPGNKETHSQSPTPFSLQEISTSGVSSLDSRS